MLKRASFGLSVVVLLSCAVALAQETPAKPKSLADDYLVGSWNAEGIVDGKTMKGSMRVQPGAGGTCLIYNWSFGSSPGDMVRGIAVGGQDPKAKEFVEYAIESDGSHFISRYPGEEFPDTGVGSGERTGTIHGKAYKGKITVDRKGRDQFVYSVASEQGEDVKLTFRRVQGEKAVSPAYAHLKALEDFIGNWVASDTLPQDVPGLAKKGEQVTLRASARWVQNKSIMQIDFVATTSGGKSNQESWHFGWDAVNKKIVYSGFDTAGGRVWGSVKKENANTWIWENTSSGPDGTQGSGKDTMTMLDGNTTHVHQLTNGVVDGKPQPDGKLVYKRVK